MTTPVSGERTAKKARDQEDGPRACKPVSCLAGGRRPAALGGVGGNTSVETAREDLGCRLELVDVCVQRRISLLFAAAVCVTHSAGRGRGRGTQRRQALPVRFEETSLRAACRWRCAHPRTPWIHTVHASGGPTCASVGVIDSNLRKSSRRRFVYVKTLNLEPAPSFPFISVSLGGSRGHGGWQRGSGGWQCGSGGR